MNRGDLLKLRTPTTPDNKYKRLGLLMVGLACIIAGVIIWVTSCTAQKNATPQESTAAIKTTASAD